MKTGNWLGDEDLKRFVDNGWGELFPKEFAYAEDVKPYKRDVLGYKLTYLGKSSGNVDFESSFSYSDNHKISKKAGGYFFGWIVCDKEKNSKPSFESKKSLLSLLNGMKLN